MSRPDRVLLALALALAAAILAAGTDAAAAPQAATDSAAQRQAMDAVAHPAPAPGGVASDPEEVHRVTRRVLCMCGGCVNETLDACTCGMAAQERSKVAAAIASGRTSDQILKEYVDEFGAQILSAPDKKGFNLIGWLVPFAVAIALLAVLTFILRGWVVPATPATLPSASAGGPGAPDPGDRSYRERLERELKEFEA